MTTFSERYNLREVNIPIKIKYEAPNDFRVWLVDLAIATGLSVDCILTIVSQKTFQGKDGNWNDDYKKNEIIDKLRSSLWFYVYDVAETLFACISNKENQQEYSNALNTYFQTNGYAWKFVEGKIVLRGSDVEDSSYTDAINTLVGHSTAETELTNALYDLSRRPHPDLSGTVHHALAAIECLLRDIFGEEKATLGEIVNKYKSKITSPLDILITKLWGYSSNHGRHMGEGAMPSFAEAQFVLYTTCAIIIFLKQMGYDSEV